MAHRAPLRNKVSARLLPVLLLAAACNNDAPKTLKLLPVNIKANNIEVKNGIYYNNKRTFTGCLFALQNSDKDTLFSGTFIDGKEDGVQKKWYPNGQLAEIRMFDRGMKTGVHKGFRENGRLRFLYRFVHDLYEGPQYLWHENGSLCSRKNYKDGQESGMQQEWDSLGKLIINYQSVNGRQYGNIGKKNCASMWMDSVYSKPRR